MSTIDQPAAEPLKHARVAFTGKLASMTRTEAFRIVTDAQGEALSNVTRRTSMLVVGMEGWPLLPDGLPSRKLRHAESLNNQGYRINILPESAFLEIAGLRERLPDLRKTFAVESVCKMLKVPLETLRRWELFSLVQSEHGQFDFQDLVTLRTIGELVSSGVRPETIASSLMRLAAVLPGTERPLAQLKIVAESSRSILADFGEIRLTPSGQLAFTFEAKSKGIVLAMPARELSAVEWFELGLARAEEEQYDQSEEAFRHAVSVSPQYPEAYFQLGNVLREQGRLEAAEEVYRIAIAQNPSPAAAWYNLADIQEERGNLELAIDSLYEALRVLSSFADAHFNLAIFLERAGRQREAVKHWEAYLRLDSGSQWTEIARRHLNESIQGCMN
jgi:tetratricopeptide (TPR) repeat protein